MYVAPGWLHQVTNVAVNVKLAWEFWGLQHMAHYVASWCYIASKITPNNAEDYMGCCETVRQGVLQACRLNHRLE